jgi:hypothetical protein
MAIADIFSTTFLFSIFAIIAMIGGIFMYVNHRAAERDAQLNSTMHIVKSLTEEVHRIRMGMTMPSQQAGNASGNGILNSSLISVSDGSVNSEEFDDSDDDSDGDDSDDDSDDDDDDCEPIDILNISTFNNDVAADPLTKTIKLTSSIEDIDELVAVFDDDIGDNAKDTEDIEQLVLSEDIDDGVLDLTVVDASEEIDLSPKKMSVAQLRAMYVEQNPGTEINVSKLPKSEVLKLLNM